MHSTNNLKIPVCETGITLTALPNEVAFFISVLKNKALGAGCTKLCIDKYAESVADQT